MNNIAAASIQYGSQYAYSSFLVNLYHTYSILKFLIFTNKTCFMCMKDRLVS